MAADAGVDSAAPNLNLNPEEKRVYGQLFRQADTDNAGVVTGEVAVKFFDKTRLDSRVLGEIWQIADRENRGFLTPAGFGIVLRLIAHAQAGREPTPLLALQQGPLPRFDGFFTPTTGPGPVRSPPPPAAAIQAQGTGGPVRIPPLTADKVAQYSKLFEHQPLQGTMLPGEQARQIFDKSGLPNEALSKIWELADTEQRGALVQTEFIIAMHLLTSLKTRTLVSLPNILPAALYEAATQRAAAAAAAAAPRQSPNNTGMSAIPRQMSGSAQPRTGSPLGRPPITPQSSGLATEWAVSPADKARFDQIYNDLDQGHKGYITGEEAVTFFGESKLPEDALAQIWDLADFNSAGYLTREGFAVAMYLIRQQRSVPSTALPSTLPPSLIPPSLRTQARPPTATSAFDPPPITKPPPAQPKSALDDLFGLDSGATSPAPAPAQTTMSTGGSNANDPFAGGNSALPPSSPVKASPSGTTFKPFIPSSSFGRGLSSQPTGDSAPKQPPQHSASDDLLGDNDEAKNISGETTELANISSQIGTLSKQMQDTQAKRTTTQTEFNQTNSQKQNFEQRLAQLRTLYEKEAQDTHALEEQLRTARNDTKKLQGECMTLEGTYRDVQGQHQQVLGSLQADQKENATLRERIRVVNNEIAQLKPQIEKLKSEARQQKGLVAINKKQLSTTEGERDKLKTEAEEVAKSNEELSRQVESSSPRSSPAQVVSPAASTASGNNPFFKRSASTDIMGVLASPPARTYSTDKSFDEVFGPAAPADSGTPPPPLPAVSFKPQNTGASSNSVGSFSTPPAGSPVLSRQATLTAEPPAPPESRQISSSFLPFPEHSDSLSSSRQVSPPGSRAEGSGSDAKNPFPGDTLGLDRTDSIPGAFPTGDPDAKDTPLASPAPADTPLATPREAEVKTPEAEPAATAAPDPFGGDEQAKAKADFDNAFAAFTTGKGKAPEAPVDAPRNAPSAFATEFPPISELERDHEESDSSSDEGGFDDDFAPASPERKFSEAKPAVAVSVPEPSQTEATPPAVPSKEPEPGDKSIVQPSSPATVTAPSATTAGQQATSVDDIFGSAASGAVPSTSHPVPSNPPAPPAKGAFDDLDDDFEGLEDAKEGSADDDFANISRSGLEDFNPVFDSSPPGSQTKTDSTAFGNESSFDFVSSNSVTGGPAPASGNQQKGAESHDWDAIFSGLDSTGSATPAAPTLSNPAAPAAPAAPAVPEGDSLLRPVGPGRALTTEGVHDDPILKNLTGMGYSRDDALMALEKYDYNLERAANYLASQS